MIDLFDYPELHPPELQEVLEAHGCPMDYDDCDFLIVMLNEIGYTCDYGLDACPYDLHKIEDVNSNLNYEDTAHLAWALNNQI